MIKRKIIIIVYLKNIGWWNMQKKIKILKEKFNNWEIDNEILFFNFKDFNRIVSVNCKTQKWEIKGYGNYDNARCFDLTTGENWSVLMLFLSLIEKGYFPSEIYLEKSFRLGHNPNSGNIDLMIQKNDIPIYFFEVKTRSEIDKYINLNNPTFTKQLFSYIFQQKTVKVGSYYSFDFDENKHIFYNIKIDKGLKNSFSLDDMYEIWNKNWNRDFYILESNKFEERFNYITYNNLDNIDDSSVKIIFNQFLTILRQNSISDKSNAFDKMINIFIAKVLDEKNGDTQFKANGYNVNGVKFQYIENVDTEISFLKRMNDLYTQGMKEFMKKDIIDCSDEELNKVLIDNQSDKIRQIIDDLRLKKNNSFSFIEVFDDNSFSENSKILIDVVKLLQIYKFKYNNRHQYLGDFFEELLNTSWKQESGQFFTPLPLVDFMNNSLPLKEVLINKINDKEHKFIPKMIDFASGSGHFLISYMDKIQKIINDINNSNTSYTPDIQKKLNSYCEDPFNWANEFVVGIEKDYRLAKTTKISGFLNGDGEAVVINGDGINKFNCDEYQNTLLYSDKKNNPIFDFVIGNPPYSVGGFMKNIYNNKITNTDFTLIDQFNMKSKEIEILFIERTHQLLNKGGYASIVLPRSLLTASQYSNCRDFILKNFKILCIFESADITFSGTTTSPIILFLQKEKMNTINYDILIINSPKMLFQKIEKEREWLGYKFSTNKNKLGIEILNDNLSKKYSPIVKNFILNGEHKPNANSFVKTLKDITLLGKTGKKDRKSTRLNSSH